MKEKTSIFISTNQRQRQLAALTWYVGSVILIYKGGSLLLEAFSLMPDKSWHFYAVALGVTVGIVKSFYIFNKSCRRNLQRINKLKNPYVWQFFRPRFFVFLFLMVITGATLSRLAHGNYPFLIGVATIDVSIGVALLISSRVFWSENRKWGPVCSKKI